MLRRQPRLKAGDVNSHFLLQKATGVLQSAAGGAG